MDHARRRHGKEHPVHHHLRLEQAGATRRHDRDGQRNSTRAEIIDEVWAQVKAHLAADPKGALSATAIAITTNSSTPPSSSMGSDKLSDKHRAASHQYQATHRQHRPRARNRTVQNSPGCRRITSSPRPTLRAWRPPTRPRAPAVQRVLKQTELGRDAVPRSSRSRSLPVFEAFQEADEFDFTVNPGLAPLLCRYLDQLVPTVSPSTSSDTVKWISIGLNIALAALSLYLLLKG